GHDDLEAVPAVPAGLVEVVRSGLSSDPEGRPTSARELARALRASVAPVEVVLPGVARRRTPSSTDGTGPSTPGAHPGPAPPDRGTRAFGPRPPRREPRPRRSRRGAALAGAALVGALLAVVVVGRLGGGGATPG